MHGDLINPVMGRDRVTEGRKMLTRIRPAVTSWDAPPV
jgi:hypothetical protein